MDGGIDLPTIMRAYTQVIEDEFNFEIEARSLSRFAHMFREAKMDHLVELPKPVHHLSTTKCVTAVSHMPCWRVGKSNGGC